ncbi:MAG TPA: polymer-forming cytoskeletal protein [Anaerolineales bacterium]|nr:polymer-forming cytoskeletal protein [Anaerolineales bacterium]
MKNVYRLVLILLIVGIAFLLPATALAQGPNEDEVVVGDTYTLKSGETLDGNLFVIGGNATIEAGATLNGDVVVGGGYLTISGLINGDTFATGGVIKLTDTANIQGDIVTLGGSVDRADGAIVSGEITEGFREPFKLFTPGGRFPAPPANIQVSGNPVVNAVWSGFWVLMRSFLWAALAVLLVLFVPSATQHVSHAAVNKPWLTGGVGLLSSLVLPVVLVILAITICLLPISLIGFLALGVAWAFGIVALGVETGKRLGIWLKQDWALPVLAGLGTFILTLVINGLNALLPCVGWLPSLLVGSVGLGAVILTRFGTQPYPPPDPISAQPAAPLLPPVPPPE